MKKSKTTAKIVGILLTVFLVATLAGCSTQSTPSASSSSASSATGNNSQPAFDAASYFKGKTITLIIGYPPGGGYDTNARLIAPYLEKYIPGNPHVLVQNMDGAASVIAANYLYSQAKPDGLTIGTIDRAVNIGISNLVGTKGLQADVRKFRQLGSLSSVTHIFLVNSKLPYTSLKDFTTLSKPASFGGTGPSSVPAMLGRMYKEYFGCNLNIVAGYPGANEAMLALTTGELAAFSINQDLAIDKLNHGLVRAIAQVGDKFLPDVPLAADLAPNPTAKALAQIMSDCQLTAYPFLLPPGTPDNITNVLRDAFMKAATDPEVQSKIKALNFIPHAVSGPDLEQKINATFNQPQDIVEALKRINAIN